MKSIITILLITLNIAIYSQPTVSYTSVISTGLSYPLQVTNAGDGSNRLFVVQKGGTIRVYDQNYNFLDTFLTVSNVMQNVNSEEGLLSIAFHPEYYSNGFFWVLYVNTAGNLEIARYRVSANDINNADPSSKRIVIDPPIQHPTHNNHNGGEMHFGKDGYLYISTGDGGSGGDPGNNGQNTSSLLGKILRINVSTGASAPYYTIPADNPFNNAVYVYGLRNPFRWQFDRYNGDMFIGDVGQGQREEVSYLHRDSISGKNLGWRCYEGSFIHNLTGCVNGPFVFPIYDYQIGSTFGRSVIGGVVYRGYEFPNLKGYYVFTDYFSSVTYGTIFNSSSNEWNTVPICTTTFNNITDFGESESGEIFVTRNTNGNFRVYKVSANGPNPTTYVFTGSGDWTTSTNWKGNAIPPNPLPSGSQIVVKPRRNGVCNLNQLQTINEGADIFIEPGSNFDINSNLTILD